MVLILCARLLFFCAWNTVGSHRAPSRRDAPEKTRTRALCAEHQRERYAPQVCSPSPAKFEVRLSFAGTVHSAPQCRSQNIHELSLRSLRLCTSLRSFSWIDDNFLPDDTFLFFLDILKTLPLQKLTIRTFGNLGSPVWEILNQFKGLRVIFSLLF